jgi:hypothetical protein
MKKILIVAVFVFAIALTANVAFAGVQTNNAFMVSNSVSSGASNGGNLVTGMFGGGTIITGGAISHASGINAVNTNVNSGFSWGPQVQGNNAMLVSNGVASGAENGGNVVAGVIGGGTVWTGGAISGARGVNLVNSNVNMSGWGL